jgi:hypothetical protein
MAKKNKEKKNTEIYDGPQSPKNETTRDTVDNDLHSLIDKEFESKRVTDLFMLALILVFMLFLLK